MNSAFCHFEVQFIFFINNKTKENVSSQRLLEAFLTVFKSLSSSVSYYVFFATLQLFSHLSEINFFKLFLCIQKCVLPSHPGLHRFHPSLRAAGTIHIQHGRGRWTSLPALGSTVHTNKSTHIQTAVTDSSHMFSGSNMFAGTSQKLNTVSSPAPHTVGVWACERYPAVFPRPH